MGFNCFNPQSIPHPDAGFPGSKPKVKVDMSEEERAEAALRRDAMFLAVKPVAPMGRFKAPTMEGLFI